MSLGQVVVAVIQMRADMRAAGAVELEIEQATARSIRSAWPQVREWKYLCASCSDYGLEMATCPGDRTCGRDRAHLAHEFGRPCWCDRGAKFRKAPASEQDFQQAGKSKQKPLTRWGR